MASPPVISFLNLPGVCLIVMAAALPPASFLIFAISALETVLSTVTTTRFVLALTAQAVPAMSDLSTDLFTVLELGGAERLGRRMRSRWGRRTLRRPGVRWSRRSAGSVSLYRCGRCA